MGGATEREPLLDGWTRTWTSSSTLLVGSSFSVYPRGLKIRHAYRMVPAHRPFGPPGQCLEDGVVLQRQLCVSEAKLPLPAESVLPGNRRNGTSSSPPIA